MQFSPGFCFLNEYWNDISILNTKLRADIVYNIYKIANLNFDDQFLRKDVTWLVVILWSHFIS